MKENEDSADPPFEENCRYTLKKYIETGNSIYAWHSLMNWLMAYQLGEKTVFPPPPELIEFLFLASYGIARLSLAKKPLEYRDGKEMEQSEGSIKTPSEACDFLPEALQLRGYKWNAFDAFLREDFAAAFQSLKQALRAQGLSESEAMQRVMAEMRVKDERTARRKLKGGRTRQKSPYPAPIWIDENSNEMAEPPPLPDPKKAKTGTKEKKAGAKKP
jgi:hypothetical protein